MIQRLTLGELERTTRFAATEFLTLNDTAVAGQEASSFQRATQGRVVELQRLGDAVLDRTGLTGEATALDGCVDVEFAFDTGNLDRKSVV